MSNISVPGREENPIGGGGGGMDASSWSQIKFPRWYICSVRKKGTLSDCHSPLPTLKYLESLTCKQLVALVQFLKILPYLKLPLSVTFLVGWSRCNQSNAIEHWFPIETIEYNLYIGNQSIGFRLRSTIVRQSILYFFSGIIDWLIRLPNDSVPLKYKWSF